MIGKNGGHNRVHKMLAKSGYGKGGARKAAEGAGHETHAEIKKAMVHVEKEVRGKAGKKRLDRPGRASGGESPKKWIAGAIKKPGALHKALHVPEGKKIPEAKLNKAAHSDNPTMRRRANLAKTLKKMH